MIYRSGVFSMKEGITPAEFRRHWFDVHGEIASRLPGLGSYRQNHILDRLFEESPFQGHRIDGISQLKFDSIAAMEVAEQSSVYSEAKADIPKFQGAITILVLGEDDRAGEPGRGKAKLLVLSAGRTSADVTAAKSGQASRDLDPLGANGPVHVICNRVIDRAHPVSAGVPQGELPIARMDEYWFMDAASLRSWFETDGRSTLFNDRDIRPMAIYAVDEVHLF